MNQSVAKIGKWIEITIKKYHFLILERTSTLYLAKFPNFVPHYNFNQHVSMSHLYPIEIVSLGPGDPELITLKSLRKLQKADFIYCPATDDASGKQFSKASDIVVALGIDTDKIRRYHLPMNHNREGAVQAYAKLCEEAKCLQNEGLRVVIAAEGDSGFYSSTQSVYELLHDEGADIRRTAGIPAFIAAGAKAGLHLTCRKERLVVLPGTATEAELENLVAAQCMVVIMKLSACAEAVCSYLHKHPEVNCHYFERLGSEDEYYTSSLPDMLTRNFPYFSLLLIIPSYRK